jgi:Na+/H+-dicarboxylate symporter
MHKSRLTLYIFIGLVLGIVAGYLCNVYVIQAINARLNTAETTIKSIDGRLAGLKDTAAAYHLKTQRAAQAQIRDHNDGLREDKLEGFTLLSDIFLRLIKMIVAPLIFTTLVAGVARVGDIKSVGRIGGKTLLWFLVATLVSLLIGIAMVNLFEPGREMHLSLPDRQLTTGVQASFSLRDFAGHIFPKSFFEAMAGNEILQIVVFSLFFGIGTAAIGEKGSVIVKAIDAIAHIILKMTGYIMLLAPLAVFGAIAAIIAKQGLGIVSTYAIFIGEFYFALLILWVVLITAGYFVLQRRVFSLVSYIKDSMMVAFGTTTSEAAYPKLLLDLERFGCDNKIVSFVLPLGYSFNLDGGMMYMTFASLFVAQAYNIHLSFGQQLTMLLILMLTSKGVAGIPRAALVVVAMILPQFNIPEAGLALLIGIDPLLDMGRSATNVLGNAVATAVVSKWEGELE